MIDILSILYLFLPAFGANAAPVLFKKTPGLHRFNVPVLPQYLGTHKTIRGFILGVSFAIVISLLQWLLAESSTLFASITLLQYSVWQSILIGILLGFGALLGDAVESFAKRRIGLKSGEALPIWDGVDYIIGALVCLSPLYIPSFWGIVLLFLIGPIASLLANTIAWLLGWKEVWY